MIVDTSAIVCVHEGEPGARRYLEVVPVDEAQVAVARTAYRDFGKRSGHPAQLNFGDCFAYALAITTGDPLLFKGGDFGHTDVVPVV